MTSSRSATAEGFSIFDRIAARVPIRLRDFVDVFGALHERQRHPVDAELQRVGEVGFVFLGQRADRQQRVGHRDALAARQHAAGHHFGVDLHCGCFDDAHPEFAVVEHQHVPRLDGLENLRMGQIDALVGAERLVAIELENRVRRAR